MKGTGLGGIELPVIVGMQICLTATLGDFIFF